MRDVERLREKIEFSLEDRQVWALGLSALLLIAGVFMIGVLVGRKTVPAPPPADDLAALDSTAVSAKPDPAAVVPSKPTPPPPAPAVEEKPAPAEKAAAEEGEKHEPAQGRAPAHAATGVPAPRPATVVQPPPRPVQVASVAPVVLTPPPRELGEFTVQVGASQDRAEALHIESKARSAGLKPYVVEADLGSKGTWYRVRVGAFADKDSANRFRKDVERELRSAAVVMPAH